MKKEYHICDIDGCENKVDEKGTSINMTMVFTTEQTEGRSIKPHLTNNNIDVCESCREKIISERKLIIGSGAQGHNTYTI